VIDLVKTVDIENAIGRESRKTRSRSDKGRAKTVTLQPSLASAFTMSEPSRPVPPKTSTLGACNSADRATPGNTRKKITSNNEKSFSSEHRAGLAETPTIFPPNQQGPNQRRDGMPPVVINPDSGKCLPVLQMTGNKIELVRSGGLS